MAPVSLTWQTMDDEMALACSHSSGSQGDEPQGPYALADVLAEIVARYAPSSPRKSRAPVAWIAIPTGAAAVAATAR